MREHECGAAEDVLDWVLGPGWELLRPTITADAVTCATPTGGMLHASRLDGVDLLPPPLPVGVSWRPLADRALDYGCGRCVWEVVVYERTPLGVVRLPA